MHYINEHLADVRESLTHSVHGKALIDLIRVLGQAVLGECDHVALTAERKHYTVCTRLCPPNQNTHLPDHFGHAGIIDEEEQFTWLIHR